MNQVYEANLPYETKLTWGALLSTALESPLFIAFSFLYRDSQSEQKTLNAIGVIA